MQTTNSHEPERQFCMQPDVTFGVDAGRVSCRQGSGDILQKIFEILQPSCFLMLFGEMNMRVLMPTLAG